VPTPSNFGPQNGEHAAHSESYYRDLFNDHGDDFDAWRASYAVYWGFVTMIDDFVGKLIDVLNEEQLMEDTIILFTSDHGENLGSHGLWQKMVAFDESIRVPLVLRIPGKMHVGRSKKPVSLIDVAPTLAELCGLPMGEWMGQNLFAGDQNDPEHPAIFAMHRPIGDWMNVTDWRMVQEGGFKYVWHNDMEDELFDLNADSAEIRNLAKKPTHHAILGSMRIKLDQFLCETNDPLLSEWKTQFEKTHVAN